MDSDGNPTLRAAQLVYSNVEEPDSPRRRRGFQVWLQTLDDELFPQLIRDEVESLLSGFHKPVKFDHRFVRRIFMPLDDGRKVLVAEARSNPKKDKFNREGRFHSHALIFDAAEFRTVAQNDPFAVFDGGFEFQVNPEEVVRADDWSKGHIPDVRVPIRRLAPQSNVAEVETIPAELLPLVAQWLVDARAERPVLALPFGPDAVERFLRKLIALLPVELRGRASFDTLWPGRGKYPPQIAGAGTADSLALWSYRQHSRFDTRRQQVQPPIAIQPNWQTDLVAHWHANQNWSEEDRGGSWNLASWLSESGERAPPEATDVAMDYIGTWPLARERWAEWVEAKCAALFPGILGEIETLKNRALEYIGPWSKEGLAKLAADIPISIAAGWIEAHLRTMAEVPEPLAMAVWSWHNDFDDPNRERLEWMSYRWIPTFQKHLHAKLRNVLTVEDEWIREYCRMSLPEEYRALGGADDLLSAMLGSNPPTSVAKWFTSVFAIGPDGEASEVLDRLNFLRAFSKGLAEAKSLYSGMREWVLGELLPVAERGAVPVAIDVAEAHPDTWAETLSGIHTPMLRIGYRLDLSRLPGLYAHLFEFLQKYQKRQLWLSMIRMSGRGHAAPATVSAGDPPFGAGLSLEETPVSDFAAALAEISDVRFREWVAKKSLDSFSVRFVAFELMPCTQSFCIALDIRNNMIVFDKAQVRFLRAIVASVLKIHRIDAETFAPFSAAMAGRFQWLMTEFMKKVPTNEIPADAAL